MGRILDSVGTKDQVIVGLDRTVVPPKHPCPKCSKEMLDHHKRENLPDRRICSNRSCRHIIEVEE